MRDGSHHPACFAGTPSHAGGEFFFELILLFLSISASLGASAVQLLFFLGGLGVLAVQL
jgi:hypothetical protein